MAKRTGEQSLRDDYAAAQTAVQKAVERKQAAIDRADAARSAVNLEHGNLQDAIAKRDRILQAIELLTGVKQIETAEPERPTRTDMDVDDSQEPPPADLSPREKQRALRHAERELADG